MNERKSTAQDFFLNLGVVATLYASVAAFLSLAFDVINKLFPDRLAGYGDPYSSSVRFAMATLIIVFPLFVWLSRIVTRAMAADQARKESLVRRWMVYITLFLSSAMLVIDLVTLLNTFLAGEISTRFLLKTLVVLVVGGIVFWHYLSEVRGTSSPAKFTATIYGSSVLVAALVISSFFVFGSPATMRKLRADDTRIQNLSSIQYQVLNHWQQKEKLPAALSELDDSISGYTAPVDPVTDKPYGYSVEGKLKFKLCADFETASVDTRGEGPYGRDYSYAYPVGGFGFAGENWKHGAGTTCFERTIDPEMYPPFKDPVRAL
ncbi:MAG TPA: DUF5671 domain-containing protein [Candidatus Paceibacterota bacterium]